MCPHRRREKFNLSDLIQNLFANIYLDTLQFSLYEEVRLRYMPEPSAPASLKEPMSPGSCLTMLLCRACAQAAGFC